MAFPPYLAVLPATFRIGLDWSTLVPKRSSCRTETSEPCLPTDYLTPVFYHLPHLISPTYPSLPSAVINILFAMRLSLYATSAFVALTFTLLYAVQSFHMPP